MEPDHTDFYSCDWGTSSFRLRRVLANGSVAGEHKEATGTRDLFAQGDPADAAGRAIRFARFLAERLRSLAPAARFEHAGPPVIVSGMASSSVGWRELPYAPVPFALDGSSVRRESFPLVLGPAGSVLVHLVSGVATATDVMRGEETELLGILGEGRFEPVSRNGVVVLPGTHSKHVVLQDGWVTDFRTYMTGELFDVLVAHSLLRASVTAAEPAAGLEVSANHAAFVEGVTAAAEHGLPGTLFKVRTRAVLGSVPPGPNRHFLSGLLIGAEVGDLRRGSPSSGPILLAGGPAVSASYHAAFDAIGMGDRVTIVPPEDVALAPVRGHQRLLAHGRNA
jgi:2-dehydro-3-deoxygalactonokinase